MLAGHILDCGAAKCGSGSQAGVAVAVVSDPFKDSPDRLNRTPLSVAPSGNGGVPALPLHSSRFGGNITGNFRGDLEGRRQRDRALPELREHALRGFADDIPQSGNSGSHRPNPGDASFSLPDSEDGPEKIVARAVRDLVLDGSLREGGLGDNAPVGSRVPPGGLSARNGSCLGVPG